MVEATNNAVAEKTTKLKNVFPGFKSISDKINEIKDLNVSYEFWIKERENIRNANQKAAKWKESMKMSWEKYHQEFTI